MAPKLINTNCDFTMYLHCQKCMILDRNIDVLEK